MWTSEGLVAACRALLGHQGGRGAGCRPRWVTSLQKPSHDPISTEYAKGYRQNGRNTDNQNNQKGIHRLVPYLAAT